MRMLGVPVAGAVGGADRSGHGRLKPTDPKYGGPVLLDRCGVRMHHPRIAMHTGNEHAEPPCGPACGEGLNWEASTRVEDPWINERMPLLDSTRVEYKQDSPLVSSHLSEMQSFWNCMPYFSVTNWAHPPAAAHEPIVTCNYGRDFCFLPQPGWVDGIHSDHKHDACLVCRKLYTFHSHLGTGQTL